MRQQRTVFEDFGMPRSEKPEPTPLELLYSHNTMIFEIYANWDSITDLMERAKKGEVSRITEADAEWLNFIINSSIGLNEYSDAEDFLNKNFREK